MISKRRHLLSIVFLDILLYCSAFILPTNAQVSDLENSQESFLLQKLFLREIGRISVFVVFKSENRATSELCFSSPQIVAISYIHLYKKLISPFWGARCNFYPSCSSFGFQAYQKYGFVHGTLMTADRLCRDHAFIHEGHYPNTDDGHFFDSVEQNYIFRAQKEED
jgi:putative membrane protein insertion efficiency factor